LGSSFIGVIEIDDDEPDEKYKKPYFVKVPKNVEVREGTVVRLDCLAFGRPTPQLTWYFNGTELKEDNTHKALINEEGVHSLLITAATADVSDVNTPINTESTSDNTIRITSPLTKEVRKDVENPNTALRGIIYFILGSAISNLLTVVI